VILDPEAIGDRARVLIDLCLERGDAPGQVVCGRVALVIGDVLAPERVNDFDTAGG